VKLLAPRRPIDRTQTGKTLGRGMDFALVVLVFLGIGYGLDRWLDTRPAFMVGMVVFSMVGQFVKMYYEYTAEMKVHEAELAARRTGAPRATRDQIADQIAGGAR